MNRPAHPQVSTGARPYRVTADDYIRMIVAEVFGDAHIELVEGELVEMSPSHSEHGRLLASSSFELTAIYRPLGYSTFIDTIVSLSENSIRAPDISITDMQPSDPGILRPQEVLLAVEIAGSTLGTDLSGKRIDYAGAGIRNYWVVDIEGRCVHTFSDPQGADYGAVGKYAFGEAMPVPGAEGTVILG